MTQTKVPCRHCNGKGSNPLAKELSDTLALFKGAKQFNSEEAQQALGLGDISRNAINNRLEDLRALGLIDRIRKGRSFYYFKAGAKTAP